MTELVPRIVPAMEFSDQTKLIYGIEIIRQLLESPTKLSTAKIKEYRRRVRRLSDLCLFNAGWYMASPDKELKGPAATAELFADVRTMTDLLQLNSKPPKRAKGGRPLGSVRPLEVSYHSVIQDHLGPGQKTLLRCVNDALRSKTLDTSIAATTHVRRIERYLDRVGKGTEWVRKSQTPPPSKEFCARCGLNSVFHPSKSHGNNTACDAFVPAESNKN